MPLQVPTDIGQALIRADGSTALPGTLAVAGAATLAGALAVAGAATFASGLLTPNGAVINPRCIHTGNVTVLASTDGNDTTPSITETYIAQLLIPCNMLITGIAFFNGSAVGTDKLVGILYDYLGAILATTALAGTTAVGTDAFQRIPLTATYPAIGPHSFYVGLQVNGTTYRANTHILGNFGASKKTGETFGTATTITPPTTFTTAVGPIATLY